MTTPATSEKQIIEVPADDKTNVEIIPFGTDERIKLNIAIVRKMVAVPTRSGKQPDDTQCMKFIMLCKARHLNPFEGDAYLLGYDTQSGAQFSLITAHQVFLKRAEASQGFDGMQSGVIVKTSQGIQEREVDLTLEGDELLGGWAKVYRSDRQHPFYRRLKISTFNTGQSRWSKDPAGMIVKCAEADALRSAFPTHLGGLYTAEERPPMDITATSIPIDRPQIKSATISARAALPENGTVEEPLPTTPRGRKPKPNKKAAVIEGKLSAAGYTVDDLFAVAVKLQWLDEKPESLAQIDDAKLDTILDEWDQVAEMIAESKKEPAKDGLFA